MNKHKAIAVHPNGNVELKRGDKVARKGSGIISTFAYVTDAGNIATQELGQDVVVNNAEIFIGIEVHKHVGTIDLTPTWEAILPILLAALEDGTDAGKKIAREELTRMAKAADAFNSVTKS